MPETNTLYVGNLDARVTDSLLSELFTQVGPVESVRRPKAKGTSQSRSYAFVQFEHDESVPYALNTLQGITLFGKQIKLDPQYEGDSQSSQRLPQANNNSQQLYRSYSTPIQTANTQQQWAPQRQSQWPPQQQPTQWSPQPAQQQSPHWRWQPVGEGAWLNQQQQPQSRQIHDQRSRLQRFTDRVTDIERQRQDRYNSGSQDVDYRRKNDRDWSYDRSYDRSYDNSSSRNRSNDSRYDNRRYH